MLCFEIKTGRWIISRKNIFVLKFMELGSSLEYVSYAVIQNFPAFYGIRKFITVFTRALYWVPILDDEQKIITIRKLVMIRKKLVVTLH
jgi:hypothetical protein